MRTFLYVDSWTFCIIYLLKKRGKKEEKREKKEIIGEIIKKTSKGDIYTIYKKERKRKREKGTTRIIYNTKIK